ncbi:hypothetical protein HAX54_028066 [Datura stramonium]|uniref:Uncharacterized protein n=1 Tax=Datura stramonium TaxID=4076 RepID=A0ABS8S9A5_DATST|nr:hypothetical protein [Datura stramonium]
MSMTTMSEKVFYSNPGPSQRIRSEHRKKDVTRLKELSATTLVSSPSGNINHGTLGRSLLKLLLVATCRQGCRQKQKFRVVFNQNSNAYLCELAHQTEVLTNSPSETQESSL